MMMTMIMSDKTYCDDNSKIQQATVDDNPAGARRIEQVV